MTLWVIFIFFAMIIFWNFLKCLPRPYSNKKYIPIHFQRIIVFIITDTHTKYPMDL